MPLSRGQIALSGVWIGAGIGAMHYTGMAAMRTDGLLRYDPWWFVLSLLVAIGLAMGGLAVRDVLRQTRRLPRLPVVLLAGSVLGCATSAMHYTAMQASLFIGVIDPNYVPWSSRQGPLALAVAGSTVLAFGFAGGMLAIAAYRALAVRLRERGALVRDILDNLPGAVLRVSADDRRRVILVSHALADLTGRSVEDFERGAWDLADVVHQEDRAAFEEALQRARATGERVRLVVRLQHAREGWRWVVILAVVRSVEAMADTPAVLDLFMADITAQHSARLREQTLLAAIDRVVGRAVLTPEGYFVEVNEKLAGVLGYTPQELVGRHHRAVWIDEAQAAEMGAFWDALRRGQAQPGDFARRAKDGSVRYLSAWYQPLFDAEGKVASVLKLAFDITERVQNVEALQRIQRELEQALASRSAFFANVSHEIRTPMNAIVGFAELLREQLPPGGARQYAQTIVDAARGLLRILNDLLDAAKLERGEFAIVTAPFRLDRLLHDLVSQHGVLAAQKGLQLRCEIEPQLQTCWIGDGDRIRQILANLLGNALKFTERGSVTLRAGRCPQGLLLVVEDTGIGIPAHRLAAVFDPFVQADAGTARRFGGTGLGMSIVKRLAERMGGSVELHSEVGRGTQVSVRLPLAPAPGAACADQAAADPADTSLPALRILAADDVAQNRELLAALLARDGHAHHIVEDGAALLAAYEADPLGWDVVLLDVHMPELDGLRTCERLRTWERTQGLPPVLVYALTASVLDSDRIAAQRAGMDGFLEKPIDPRALRCVLHAAAQRRRGERIAEEPTSPTGGGERSPASVPDGEAVADGARGRALWGEDWLARVRAWHAEMAPQWCGHGGWDRAQWHRVAGVAANLALPALAQAARDCERACVEGQPLPLQRAQQAWQALGAWLAQQVVNDARCEPDASGATAATLPAALRTRLLRACDRGEIDEEALAQTERLDAAAARALRARLETFDFDGARALLTGDAAEILLERS
ncbi:MAG: ATP-binding protein [Burkholderiaceae bacterium]|nr:ATP-binding protein [Burkholderiaceae bacterium]